MKKNLLVAAPVYKPTPDGINSLLNLLNHDDSSVAFSVSIDGNHIPSQTLSRLIESILETLAWKQGRVVVSQGMSRKGLIENWNASVRIGQEIWPESKLFCWISDHDWVSKEFYLDNRLHRKILTADSIGIAVPKMAQTADGKEVVNIPVAENQGVKLLTGPYSPGFQIYSIFSRNDDYLLPKVLLPDKLFIAKTLRNRTVMDLSNNGSAAYIRWRLKDHEFSIKRQRKSLFNEKSKFPALVSWTPWWITHIVLLVMFDIRQTLKGLPPRSGWRRHVYFDLLARSITLRRLRKNIKWILLLVISFTAGYFMGLLLHG